MRIRMTAAVAVALLAGATLSWAPADAQATVTRYFGPDRYATAATVSAARFAADAPAAYVATGESFPDALAAGPVAGSNESPVLLVRRDAVPDATANELRRLAPRRIFVVGGTGAVSAAVETQLRQFTAGTVTRLFGGDRFGTAAAVSASWFTPANVRMVFVATGADFPDALSGSWAGVRRGPVLLVTRDVIPEATDLELNRLKPATIAVLGGPNAVSDALLNNLRAYTSGNVDRLSGPDRFATSVAVSKVFAGQPDEVFVSTGRNFPDALAGGPAAAHGNDPVLLSEKACAPDAVRAEVARLNPGRIDLVGGPNTLDDRVGRMEACGAATITLTTLATGLQVPWDVAFVPGGRTYITERLTGRLLLRDANGAITEVQRFPIGDNAGEGGLLGLAASPSFAQDNLLYVYFTSATDNRVVRFQPGQAGTAILTGIAKGTNHDAGRIGFGPDGMLYVATGDAGTSSRSQDPASPNGKILRLRPDGGVPSDNPRAGSLVYAMGLRDPQGITWDAQGHLFADEFGPDRDDEVNIIVPNGNYGWPTVTGDANDPRFIDPVVVRQPDVASWSGNEVLVGGAIPQWEGDLFVAALRGTRLYRFDLAGDGSGTIVGTEELYNGQFGRIRHVEQAPDGSLWLLTSNRDGRGSPVASDDRILRIAAS